jgi:hypothetical protein
MLYKNVQGLRAIAASLVVVHSGCVMYVPGAVTKPKYSIFRGEISYFSESVWVDPCNAPPYFAVIGHLSCVSSGARSFFDQILPL